MSAQLKSLEEKVSASSVFDAEKVEAIKSAIANGQFKVTPQEKDTGFYQYRREKQFVDVNVENPKYSWWNPFNDEPKYISHKEIKYDAKGIFIADSVIIDLLIMK